LLCGFAPLRENNLFSRKGAKFFNPKTALVDSETGSEKYLSELINYNCRLIYQAPRRSFSLKKLWQRHAAVLLKGWR